MANNSGQTDTAKRKRKIDSTNTTRILADCTVRDFAWYYLEVSLVTEQSTSSNGPIDTLTAKRHLTAAMTQRFGIIGSAVTVDILKLENNAVWIRAPYEDRMIITEALSGWTGKGVAWQVKKSGPWLGGLIGSRSRHLFDD